MSFLLHTERVAAGTPRRWAYVLHGIFGSAANWRLFMRTLSRACPDWGFVLVDQRGHHRSRGALAPHTIVAMADDLIQTEQKLAETIDGVIGHSLGGKVALAYADRRRAGGRAPLAQMWVLDAQPGASPGARPGGMTVEVLETLEALPATFARRADFVAAVRQAGQSEMVAAWLAMNVRRGDDGRYALALDLPALRSILWDYHAHDAWGVLESASRAARETHVVVGQRSYVWGPGDEARLAALDDVAVLTLPEAGHWVHVDAPEAIQGAMRVAFAKA